MDAMTKACVPTVVAPGCLDMANYGERKTLPPEHEDRNIYIHNPQVTLLRTNANECRELGRILAEKANANPAPTAILIPRKAISIISAVGQPFHDAEADQVRDFDEEINSKVFAEAAAHKLLSLIDSHTT